MFSQAFNNSTSLSGQPDPQTGTFSFKQSFGTIKGDAGFGPECDLAMSFSTLSTTETDNTTGLGRGFSFTLGNYAGTPEAGNETITLNSGESYQVIQSGTGQPWRTAHKLKDIIIEKNSSTDEITVKHKNGDIETLKTTDDNPETYFLDTYKGSSGRFLKFTYDCNDFGYYALTSIADTNDVQLVSVQYNSSNVVIIVNPNSSGTERKQYTVSISSGAVQSIQLPDYSEVFIQYDYKTISSQSLMLIRTVEYENGAKEQIEYLQNMYLCAGAPIEYLPVMTKYTKTVSDDQSIVSTYAYSDPNNYWGRSTGAIWESSKDSLLYLTEPYDYSSTVTCGNKVTITTYDRFHQTKEVVETNGDDNVKSYSSYEYASDETVDLDGQPNTYELPTAKIMYFENLSAASAAVRSRSGRVKSSRGRDAHRAKRQNLSAALSTKRGERKATSSIEYREQYEYDDYGNTLTKIEASGLTTINEYYSADGDGGNCPPHPYDMVCYKKSETQQAYDGSESKVKTFTYRVITAIDGNTQRCVVISSKTYQGCATSYDYYGTSDPSNIRCNIKSSTVSIGGNASTKTYSYTIASDWIQIQETLQGHDSIASSVITKLSLPGLLTLEERDRKNIVTSYTYDVMERLASLTVNPGSDYETITSYTYFEKYDNKIGTLTRQTDSKGVRKEIFYNGVSQQLYEKQQDEFGNMRTATEQTYDNEGRALSYTRYDYIFNTDETIASTHTDTVTNIYGKWGELLEVQHNNGVCELQGLDPITLIQTSQVIQRDSGGSIIAQKTPIVIKYDLDSHKERVDIMNLSGSIYSTTQYTYDGFGRSVSTITPLNQTASVDSYDEYDRPTQVTHLDGTSFNFDFVTFSAKRAITAVRLSDMTLGSQAYDSLLRCTNRTVNDVSIQFDYSEAEIKPSRMVNARGQTVLFDYLNELGGQTKRHATFSNTVGSGDWEDSSKLSDVSYTYAKKSDSAPVGRILNATCSNGITDSNSYSSIGFNTSSTQTVAGVSKTVSTTKITLMGKPVEYSIGSRNVTLTYDNYGRIITTTDGNYVVESDYGHFDQVSEERIKQGSTILQTTTITYDDLGRESSRTISCGKSITITNGFDVESKITSRTTAVDSNSLNETFTYDARRRLLTYNASANSNELLPRNEHGKAISSQSFAYDNVGNITSIVTGFPNGDSNTATFSYDATNKFRINQISNSLSAGDNAYPATISFTYDADGNALTMNDTTMTYKVSGRLISKNGVSYSYDSYDRLVKTGDTTRVYAGLGIAQEYNGSSTTDFINHGDSPILQVNGSDYNVFGLNRNNSVISVRNSSSTTTTSYSPFGCSNNNVRVGFNGQMKDVGDSNCYPLGFGTRFFLPSIGGFTGLDSFSPFTSGDMNPYRYCEGDPINASDPSGHSLLGDILFGVVAIIAGVASIVAAVFSGGSTLAITLAVIGGVVGIASTSLSMAASVEASKGNEGTADILNKVSMGLGILSTFLSLGSSVAGASKTASSRTSMKKASTQKDFFKITKENDGIGLKRHTTPSVGIDMKSKGKYELNNNFRTMKIAPDGKLSLSDDISKKSTKSFGKIKVTMKKEAKTSRKQFFNKDNQLRSLPSTLRKTGDIKEIATGVGSLGYKIHGIVTNWDTYSTPPATSESNVDQSVYSAYGIPINLSIDDEEDDDDDGAFL